MQKNLILAHPLLVSVYRPVDFGDCTLGGITSREAMLLLCEPDMTIKPTDEHRAIAVIREADYIFAVPWEGRHKPRGRWAFGGNMVHTSDSRMPVGHAIKVHDRDMSKERR